MKCRDRWIKTRLPAFAAGTLPPEKRERVLAHLRACEHCEEEHTLLESVKVLRVPDPGEEHWSSQPGRIMNEILLMEEMKQKGGGRLRLFHSWTLPVRWKRLTGLAAGSVAAVALLFALFPAKSPITETNRVLRFKPVSFIQLGMETDILSEGGQRVADISSALDIDLKAMDEGLVLMSGPSGHSGLDYLGMTTDALRTMEMVLDEMSRQG